MNIRNIISSFNSPKTFFLNENDKFILQTENFLREQFAKKDRNLVDIDSYVKIHGENAEDLNSLFNFHIKQINKGDHKLFRMDYADWLLINRSLRLFQKKGNRIVPPSKYL